MIINHRAIYHEGLVITDRPWLAETVELSLVGIFALAMLVLALGNIGVWITLARELSVRAP